MSLSRRGFLGALLTAAVAPAIIRTPGLIMPIKPSLVTALPIEGDTLALDGHLYVFRTRIPPGLWRSLYQGVAAVDPGVATTTVRARSLEEAKAMVDSVKPPPFFIHETNWRTVHRIPIV